jgi:sterol-4alpha-carboxylate 3-dehydrogenase (decarboxylating)
VLAGKPYFVTNAEPRTFWGFMGDVCQGMGYDRPHIK